MSLTLRSFDEVSGSLLSLVPWCIHGEEEELRLTRCRGSTEQSGRDLFIIIIVILLLLLIRAPIFGLGAASVAAAFVLSDDACCL